MAPPSFRQGPKSPPLLCERVVRTRDAEFLVSCFLPEVVPQSGSTKWLNQVVQQQSHKGGSLLSTTDEKQETNIYWRSPTKGHAQNRHFRFGLGEGPDPHEARHALRYVRRAKHVPGLAASFFGESNQSGEEMGVCPQKDTFRKRNLRHPAHMPTRVTWPPLGGSQNNGFPAYLKITPRDQLSHSQHPVVKWSTPSHVKNYEGGRSYFWLGLSLTDLHLPGF